MDTSQPSSDHPTSEQLVRRTIVPALLLGAALAFLLTGRTPGWQPFALVSIVAFISLLFTYISGRGSDLLGFFALALLLLAMFWEPGRPWAALTGTVLVLLNAFNDARKRRTGPEISIVEVQPPESPNDGEGYVGI